LVHRGFTKIGKNTLNDYFLPKEAKKRVGSTPNIKGKKLFMDGFEKKIYFPLYLKTQLEILQILYLTFHATIIIASIAIAIFQIFVTQKMN